MFVEDNPEASLEDVLAHYGVLGMKWGQHRMRANTADIHAARTRLANQRVQLDRQHNKATRIKDPAQRKEALKVSDRQKRVYLNSDDRVVANRMTRGEKIAAALLLTPVGAATVISITSARSRRIERKQDKNKYLKK